MPANFSSPGFYSSASGSSSRGSIVSSIRTCRQNRRNPSPIRIMASTSNRITGTIPAITRDSRKIHIPGTTPTRINRVIRRLSPDLPGRFPGCLTKAFPCTSLLRQNLQQVSALFRNPLNKAQDTHNQAYFPFSPKIFPGHKLDTNQRGTYICPA